MSKKKKVVSSIVVILVLAFLITPMIYITANKIRYADRVKEYLFEDKMYTKNEIESVEGIWGVKTPSFYVVVTFQDEPDVAYIYFAHNRIFQFGYTLTEEGKLKGIKESDLKHIETQ